MREDRLGGGSLRCGLVIADLGRRTRGGTRAFQPRSERLEDRLLLAIDLGGPAPGLPNVATIITGNTPPGPFGVALGGAVPNGGAGYSVTDVGDVNGDGFDDFFVGAPTVTTNTAGNRRPAGHRDRLGLPGLRLAASQYHAPSATSTGSP